MEEVAEKCVIYSETSSEMQSDCKHVVRCAVMFSIRDQKDIYDTFTERYKVEIICTGHDGQRTLQMHLPDSKNRGRCQ